MLIITCVSGEYFSDHREISGFVLDLFETDFWTLVFMPKSIVSWGLFWDTGLVEDIGAISFLDAVGFTLPTSFAKSPNPSKAEATHCDGFWEEK